MLCIFPSKLALKMKKIILAIGTGLGAGYIPVFPGTVGTLWGVAIYLWLQLITTNPIWHTIVALSILIVGILISGKCEEILGNKDHQSIVIDEIGGFLIGMIGISYSPFSLFLGFILFRIFDIVKPFHINKLRHLPAGWGVVTDDLAAGILTNIFLRIVFSMLNW